MKTKPFLAVMFLVNIYGLSVPRSQSSGINLPQRNQHPVIQSFASSQADKNFCPFVDIPSCGYTVNLEVTASDPNNDKLTYRYWVSFGEIIGTGAQVVWDLRKGKGPILGQQTARVEVTDGRGGKASSSVSINVRICGNCDVPPCRTLEVSCQDNVAESERTSFKANVSDDESRRKLRFHWKVVNGKIVSGQGSQTLTIRSAGLPGEVVTATVDVEGFPASCIRTASCSVRIEKRKP